MKTDLGAFEVFAGGHGPALCVTHLYSEFNESGDRFASQFLAHRRVYLVNLRGAGRSDDALDEADLSMAQAVCDLESVRQALGLRNWDFAGHSTGGMLGLLYATLHPESLNALIVAGAAASNEYNRAMDCIYHRMHPRFHRMQELIEDLKSKQLTDEERRQLTRQRTMLSLHHPDRYDKYFTGDVSKRIATRRLHYFSVHDYPNFDVRSELPGLRLRTLILCGRHDVQCPLWCSQDIHALIPDSRLVIFDESNHYPFLEEPDKFQEAIKLFLG